MRCRLNHIKICLVCVLTENVEGDSSPKEGSVCLTGACSAAANRPKLHRFHYHRLEISKHSLSLGIISTLIQFHSFRRRLQTELMVSRVLLTNGVRVGVWAVSQHLLRSNSFENREVGSCGGGADS